MVVADDARELASLKDSFAEIEGAWEVQYYSSREAAVSYLDEQTIEIVFAELTAGPLAGTHFLHEVWKRCPKAARFLLGSGMESEVMVECVLGAHQFVEKPLDAFTLKNLLDRTQAINRLIQNPNVQTLVSRMRTLPSRPSVSLEIMKELRSRNASAQVVGELIAKDLSISSKLIQVVNSAYYGWARQVSEPGDAVILLGMEATASLVLSIESFAKFDKIKPLYFSIDEVWRHSQRVAHTSKMIAETISGDSVVVKDAFTAGLLHDIGKLALALNFEEQYRNAIGIAEKNNLSTCQAEMQIFGACHPEAGAYLLSVWGLPISIIEAVASHHQPARDLRAPFSAATAVHLAERFAHEEELKRRNASDIQADLDYAPELNLQPQMDILRHVTQDTPLPSAEARSAANPPTVAVAVAVPQVREQPVELSDPPAKSRKSSRVLAFAAVLIAMSALVPLFTPTHWTSEDVIAKAALHPTPVAPAKGPEIATNLPPKTASQGIPETAPSFPQLKLQAVMYDGVNSKARINGRSLSVGDEIEGVRVAAIKPGLVVIERSGVQRKLELR